MYYRNIYELWIVVRRIVYKRSFVDFRPNTRLGLILCWRYLCHDLIAPFHYTLYYKRMIISTFSSRYLERLKQGIRRSIRWRVVRSSCLRRRVSVLEKMVIRLWINIVLVPSGFSKWPLLACHVRCLRAKTGRISSTIVHPCRFFLFN